MRYLKDGRIWGAEPLERFLAKIRITPCDCWEMGNSLDGHGYSRFAIGKKRYAAHRWLYEQLVGPIPSGLELDHLCRNHRCCNPDHLEPVPRKVNSDRGYSRAGLNTRKQTCPEGHPLETKAVGKNGNPYRRCRACHNAQQRAYVLRSRQRVRSEKAVSL